MSRRYSSGSGGGCGVAIGAVSVLSIAVAIAVWHSEAEEEVPEVTADCVIASQQVDGTYQVVDDRYCEGGSHAAYHVWLYGSSTTSRTGYVRGGTTAKPANAQITTRAGKVISRGGFGGRGSTGGG